MTKKIVTAMIYIQMLLCNSFDLFAQSQTVGLFVNDTTRAWRGYTLMAPKQYTATYLINNQGRLVHRWSRSTYPPGQSVYLLPNGNLLRACQIPGQLGTGGGEGGRIEEYSWGDTLVWQFTYSSSTYQAHHDIRPLPNGNVLMLAVEKKTVSQLLAAGFDPSKFQPEITTNGFMLPDYVIEVQPTRPSGGNIVWQWHVWDHLIQDFDSTKLNYGVVRDHPELIDTDGDGRQLPVFWNHMNSIAYNARFDQIILSVRGNSEVWVIDHSTTTAEAAGHTGGRYGRGGDLLYRWGNPACYKIGNASNQKLYQQHDAQWIDSTSPGGGNMLAFNNGLGRNYSSVDQFAPPVDSLGFYYRAPGTAFGPTNFAWTYTATPPSSMYSWAISGAQRLPNGNTLICDGIHGIFVEATSAGETVWKYVNPVTNHGPLTQGDSIPQDPTHPGEYMNMVFRVQRYSPTYQGLIGRDLTPGDFIELYPTSIQVADSVLMGWNMISLPVTDPVPDDSAKHVFPTITSRVFQFSNGYVGGDTLANGIGYWGKFPSATTQLITGTARAQDSISVSTGWNMVGSISNPVDTGTIVSVPAGLRSSNWFGYTGGYVPVGQISPGKGYWVKSSGAGTFVLASSLTAGVSKTRVRGMGTEDVLNSITITDSKDGTQTLYFGVDENKSIPVSMYALPPLPPVGAFDARFETSNGGSMVRTHGVRVSDSVEFRVMIQSETYPLTITWKVSKGTASYVLTDDLGGRAFQPKEMRGEGSMKITNSALNKFTVRLTGDGQLPKDFALAQNYPNPFNPSTTIRYDLPIDTRVTLKLFDILGQEVVSLVDEDQKAGYRSIEWNATNVASGVYFYRIQAGDFVASKKLLLVK